MADDRLARVRAAVGRIEGVVRWLAARATRAALVAAMAALVTWVSTSADDVTDWWQGTVESVLLLVLLIVPAGWLLNVRLALAGLLALPDELGDVVRRRGRQLRRGPVERPAGGLLGAVREVRSVAVDHGRVTGSWALVVQLVTPWFWGATLLAVAAVPVLVVVALVTAVVAAA